MYRRTIKRILLGFVVVAALVALFGKVSIAASDGGNSAADFLQIGMGAQAAGMGGAFTAMASGSSATYWNPAGLIGTERTEIQLSHFKWYQDINLENAAAAIPLGERFTIGASVTFLDYGNIEGYDADGAATGSLSAYDWTGGISLGVRLTDYLSSGFTLKYIGQTFAEVNASTFAADFGLKYQIGHLSIAAVAANVGKKMDFQSVQEKLPTSERLGVAFGPIGRYFVMSIEGERLASGETAIRNGLEFGFNHQYYLRAGYNYYPDREYRTLGTGVSVGAGLRFNRLGLDYAFTPADSYTSETLHRFSLVLSLGH